MRVNKAEGVWYAHAHAMSIASALLMHANMQDQQRKDTPPVLPSFHSRIACITYVAFALEGYLHLVGQMEFEKNGTEDNPLCACLDCWKRKPTREKLKEVCRKFGVVLDLGKSPHDLIIRLIDFRDAQAHPKLIRVNDSDKERSPEAIFDDLTIYQHLNPSDAVSFYEEVRKLVMEIEKSRPDGNPDIWVKISQFTGSESN